MIITVTSYKGGVGKTTTAIHLAAYLQTLAPTLLVDGDHGRIETRRITVFADIEWLRERHDWPGLRSLIMVESTREIGGKIENETRFYIASFEPSAQQAGSAVRSHWLIENSSHWQLDVHLRDDDCRVRKDNARANFEVDPGFRTRC